MTEKERLIELLENAPAAPNGDRNVSTLADYLVANKKRKKSFLLGKRQKN